MKRKKRKIKDNTKTFSFYNFAGGLNYRDSDLLINQAPELLDAYEMQNVEIHTVDIDVDSDRDAKVGIQKMKGNVNQLESSFTKSIVGVGEYVKGDKKYGVFNTLDGEFYLFDPDDQSYSKKYDSFTSGQDKYTYGNFNNGVMVNNGSDDALFFEVDGSPETATFGLGADYRGLPMIARYDRVFMAGASRLSWSALGTYDTWTGTDDAGYNENFFSKSGTLTALSVLDDKVIIHRRDNVYVLTGDDYSNIEIDERSIKGAVGPHAIFNIEESYFFFNGEEVRSLENDPLYQVGVSGNLADKITGLIVNLDQTRLNETILIAHPRKKQLWMYVPTTDCESGMDTALIYDFNAKCWIKRKQQPIQCAAVIDGEIYTGTSDGKLLKENTGNTFDGDVIEAYYYTPFLHFGVPTVKKSIDEFYLALSGRGKNKFRFVRRYNTNYNREKSRDIEVNNTDVAIFDQSRFDSARFAFTVVTVKRTTVSGLFYSVQFGFVCGEEDSTFNLDGFECREVEYDY